MRFEQLEQFVALGNLRHFRQAAEQTSISTSALTRSIQTLEDEIGCKLVVRSTRSVRLTEQGELFLNYCKGALSELSSVKQSIQKSLHGKDQEKLVIGYTNQMSSIVPTICGQFLASHPNIKIEMQLLDELELLKKLQLGELDISVYQQISEHTSSDIYLPDQLVMFVARSHPLLSADVLSKTDLVNYPMYSCFSQSQHIQMMLNEAAEGLNKAASMKVGNINEVLATIKNTDQFAIAGIEHAKLIAQDPDLVLLKTNKDAASEQLIVQTNHHISEEEHIQKLVSLLEQSNTQPVSAP